MARHRCGHADPDFKREFDRLANKWNDLAIPEELDSRSVLQCVAERQD
jgi:hypothetical protein